jgi:hypothetical protein
MAALYQSTKISSSYFDATPKSVLSRFLHGTSGLSVPNIDALCRELELELRKRRKSHTKKG